MRKLFYGDNYDILQRYIDDESVDLVYLDPPFKSDQNYNVLFRDHSGDLSTAQIQAFEDTWTWDMSAARSYEHVVTHGPDQVSLAMQAFRKLVGESDMLAYLAMMAPRLVELHRVLKPTGSLYLHCDPAAGHYLKILLDAVFGPSNFQNEIIWKRTSGHSDARRYGRVHDNILFYTKSDGYKWNDIYQPYDEEYVEKYYRYQDDDGRRFMSDNLSAAGLTGGGYEYEWKGVTRVWRLPEHRMKELDEAGRIYYTRNGFPRYKRYLDEMPGLPAQDVWTDVQPLRSWHQEKLGYPTQKPEELLQRIITASSDEGDVVLDPFCGCGTTIAAAEGLKRSWIGIDITPLAITLIKHRLLDAHGIGADDYEVIGEPTTVESADALAVHDRDHFELWALGLVGARPHEQKKGADRGIDGRRFFIDDPTTDAKEMIISVKSGSVGVAMVRDLRGTVEREDAAIGVFITLQEPTSAMRKEAASAGFYKSPFGEHPRIQILTIEELLQGKAIDFPGRSQRVDLTFKKAKKAVKKPESRGLFD